MGGVSQQHRQIVSSRYHEEEEDRRAAGEANPKRIIDHGSSHGPPQPYKITQNVRKRPLCAPYIKSSAQCCSVQRNWSLEY